MNIRLEMLTDSLVETEHFQKNIVLPYFKDIYKDLANRSENPTKGIEKFTILQYCNLPGVYGDRFFAILDTDGSGFIELKEFLVGFFRVYCSDFETNLKLAFEFYDFDKDGFISEEDVSLVLSYADIHHNGEAEEEEESNAQSKITRRQSQSPRNDFEDRLANQKEIAKITDEMFGKKKKIGYEEFKNYNTSTSSETILCILKTLKTYIPCTDNFYKYLKDYRSDMKKRSMSPPEELKSSPIAGSRSTTFKATSPKAFDMKNKSFLFNASKNVKQSPQMKASPDEKEMTKEQLEENIVKNASKLKNAKEYRKERIQRQSTITETDFERDLNKEAIRKQNITKLKVDTGNKNGKFTSEIQSPTTFLEKEESKISKI
jgi:Ca2+-binding EF-hand superfamily protein